MSNVGQPMYFNLEAYYETIEGFINSDEVKTALKLIDLVPAYYRDSPPQKLLEIKKKLHKAIWTPLTYKGIYKDVVIDEVHTKNHWPTRASIAEHFVLQANQKGIIPNVSELAPGSLWFPAGLTHHGLKFTYERMSLDDDAHPFEKPVDPKFNIFIAWEILEHLNEPYEIYQNYLKFGRDADVVLISTPLYCYNNGMPNGLDRELGHLVAFTPGEFMDCVIKMFPGYKWECRCDEIIHAIGEKPRA